jgi:TonB family protein
MTGICVLSVTVGVDGQTHDITIVRSIAASQPQELQSIAAGLDANAVKAVEQYRFEPSTYQGKPVAVAINIEVAFRTF